MRFLKISGAPHGGSTGFFFIIGALVVGYLKDRFIWWLARSSEWYRRRKAASLARKEEEIERLVSEPLVLILLTLRSAIAWMFFFFSFGLFLFIPVWNDLIVSSPTVASWFLYRPWPTAAGAAGALKMTILVSAMMALLTGYWAMYSGTVAGRAFFRLQERREVSPLQSSVRTTL